MTKIVFKKLMMVVAIMVFGPCCVLAGEEEKPVASAEVGVFSKYVWRGWEYSEDSVVVQPSVTVGYQDLSLNFWGNLDTDNKVTEDPEYNETDFTLAYDKSIGNFDIGVGYIYYALNDANDPEEIYVKVCASAVPLAPTITVYRDITEVIGWYVNLGVSHSFEIKDDITLDIGGAVGYYYSQDDIFVDVDNSLNSTSKKYRGLHDGQISVAMTIPIDKYLTLTPMMAYSFPLSGNADDLITAYNQDLGYSSNSSYFYGGAKLSLSF